MKPIRVAMLFTSLVKGGGAEKQMKIFLQHCDKKKITPFVYTFEGGEYEKEFASIDIPVRNLDVSPRTFAAIGKLRKQLKEDKVDICHSLLMHGNLISRWACLGMNIKLINSVRWAERIPGWHTVDKLTRGRVNYWIANSKHGARIAQLPKNKSRVVNNGILPEFLDKPLSKTWKFKKKGVMIARMRRDKSHDTLIRAAAHFPDWRFDLVGGGERQGEHEALAKELGLKNVYFYGFKKSEDILLDYGACILLSASEGSPNTTLDSMALGVPVIASDNDAHVDLLSNGEGILVNRFDVDSVVQAIKKLEGMSKKDIDAMRKKAKKHVQAKYNVSQLVEKTQDVYMMVMGKN